MISEIAGLAEYLQMGGLEKDWRRALGIDIFAEIALGPISVDLLSNGELAQYCLLEGPLRRRSWLTGRAALKRVLRRLDLGSDTSRIEFPAAEFSLSHASEIAIAVACTQKGQSADSARPYGLGVDIEKDKPVRPETARFFLSPNEQERLTRQNERPEVALLRTWTIKEAVFKADRGNRGRLLSDYHLLNAAAREGIAHLKTESPTPVAFHYISQHLAGWHISVAAQLERKHGQG